MKAINELAIPNSIETPNEPNLKFKAEVENWMKERKVSEYQAVLFKCLESLLSTNDDVEFIKNRAYGNKIDIGKDAKSNWLNKMAKNLFEKAW